MKITELRIGNYLWLSDKEKIWEILDGHEIDEVDENPFVEPILLTEEWIIKLGYVKDGNKRYFHPDTIYHTLYNTTALEKGFKIQANRRDYLISNELKHVHQLQNLYYALTGLELKINK